MGVWFTTACVQSKEGAIEEESALWADLSAADQAKRRAAGKEKALKLRSPNFFVSPTRLHLLNVPLAWDSKQLKAVCRAAVIARSTRAQPRIKQARPDPRKHRWHSCVHVVHLTRQ